MMPDIFDAKAAVDENRTRVLSQFIKLRYTDGATTLSGANRKFICAVPAGSIITGVFVRILTGFNAAGNDYLTVGTSDDDDLLVDDLSLATAAPTKPTFVSSTTVPHYTDSDIELFATYLYSSTAPTAGECEVAVEYVGWQQGDTDY